MGSDAQTLHKLDDDETLGTWQGSSELQGFITYALMAEEVEIIASFDPRVVERWKVGKMLC
ncbi:uncharacterized protein K460DRAFT_366798 [Cucurbitaria berberidis CBS 394.84]|uniref:Uncharacterized protein n=1 Tax=Cucurbitaria berberidis CBS 394.84 TaxID=1168544 RepID=A0A9P4GIP8_9PLEO|nr:uncharacterized protein K460DRAFT_366798 [Cucurbitaria berberidis CBS 394.84]KAF1845949.1 hypothetical protein K460DRAFT_366798 [Cucurbitaria berberidis CBS 394.84]